MRVRFHVTTGKDAGACRSFDLDPDRPLVVGRAEDCDYPLWDEAASRRHAQIEWNGEGLFVVDLDSSNGTVVNGETITRRSLTGGETVRIGETEFRVETEAFQRRDTVLLRSESEDEDDFTIESVLSRDAVNLGPRLAAEGRGDRLNLLLEVVDEVQDAEGGEDILRVLLTRACEVAKLERVVAVPVASRSREPLWSEALYQPPSRNEKISRSVVRRTLAEGVALCVSDAATDPLTRDRESIIGRRVGSILSVPIAARSRIHGVLYLEAPTRSRSVEVPGFDEEDLAYFATLGQVTGMALQNAERLQRSRRLLLTREGGEDEIVTQSDSVRKCIELLSRFAHSGGPVLIVGATGTGKELLARRAHREGPFRGGPWIPVNCAAIPESLLESELFGHEKGAFTGATGRKAGMFELAHQGTLFLDEIGDMPLELQPKLLRVLETGEFFRIGGRSPVSVELLIVSATHRDLENSVAEGRFREDLFFRLSRFRVDMPPLRVRPEDVELLALRFLADIAKRSDRPLEFSPSALSSLKAYPWPGNVRELKNVVERAGLIASDPVIRPNDLALPTAVGGLEAAAGSAEDSPPTLEQVEEQAIRRALRFTGGKKGECAELLGIAWPTLRRKLKKYKIDPEDP